MESGIRNNVNKTVLILVAIVAVIMGLTFYKYTNKPSLTLEELQRMGTVVFDKPRTFDMKGMVDNKGQPFNQTNLEGKWSLVYFGYTFCPDICPTTLGQLNQMDKLLKNDNPEMAKKMHYFMVTVDPRRDTVEKLNGYVPHFNPDFVGVTGSQKAIHNLAVQMNIPYTPVIDPEDEYYLVDHGANLVIINPKGDYHGFIRPPLDSEKLARVMVGVDELYQE
ncbi:SCO family protein [Endozoicomonas sp. 8E]|uniref:SCO family protein n=1 Tax=Endozoicomonas sp. 8E TaxID=3035692 RepID=UPI002938E446|nr:SCO family protein [Endozoicomonas sp. 8E]WOG28012.1 SCO family protein [Endozoicomonas sp. 8E]